MTTTRSALGFVALGIAGATLVLAACGAPQSVESTKQAEPAATSPAPGAGAATSAAESVTTASTSEASSQGKLDVVYYYLPG